MVVSRSLGKYQLHELLASDSIADVFRASTRADDGGTLGLVFKLFRPDLVKEEAFREGFLKAAERVTRLAHPNIARTYEWGQQGQHLFMAMELIHGVNLASFLKRLTAQTRSFPPALSLYLVQEVLAGLTAAEAPSNARGEPQGLNHGVLGPENIIVSSSGEVKIFDFGWVAVAALSDRTRPSIQRKHLCRAPEVLGGEGVDARTDVYSCGAILVALLAGNSLQSAGQTIEEPEALLGWIREHPLASLNPDIPADLGGIVHQALALHPEARFSSCREMQEALEGIAPSWAGKMNRETLASFLREVLTGKAPEARRREDASFGEATSEWLIREEDPARAGPCQWDGSGTEGTPPVVTRAEAKRVRNFIGIGLVFMVVALTGWLVSWWMSGAPEKKRPSLTQTAGPAASREPVAPTTGAATHPAASPGSSARGSLTPPLESGLAAPPEISDGSTAGQAASGTVSQPGPSAASAPEITSGSTAEQAKRAASAPEITSGSAAGQAASGIAPQPGPSAAAAPEVSSESATEQPKRAASAQQTAKAAVAPAAPILLVVHPAGAEIRIDGKPVKTSRSTRSVRGLSVGEHRVLIRHPGYLPYAGTFRLQKGKPFTLQQTLKERRGRVVIRTTPARASLFLDGKPVGKTPATLLNLSAAQTYQVMLKMTGLKTLKFELGPADWPDDPARALQISRVLSPGPTQTTKKR